MLSLVVLGMLLPAPPAEPAGGLSVQAGAVLADKCMGCHGRELQKGGLALHTFDLLTKGGDDGEVIVAGKPEASDLFRRLTLAGDDDEHMPPKSKPQLSQAEIESVKRWIVAGCPGYGELNAAMAEPKLAVEELPVVAPADAKHLSKMADAFVHVEQVARGSNLLVVSFAAVAPQIDDAKLAEWLKPIREQVAELNIARAKISDRSAELLAGLPHLTTLDMSSTGLTADGLRALSKAKALRRLTVSRCKFGPGAAMALAEIPNLRIVHAWAAGFSPEDAASLRAKRVDVLVDIGDLPDSAALEREEKVPLTSDAPPIDAAKPSATQVH